MKSQNTQILAALKKGESITPLDALKRFDCLRLGARIKNIRDMGYQITTTINQTGKRYAVYSMDFNQ